MTAGDAKIAAEIEADLPNGAWGVQYGVMMSRQLLAETEHVVAVAQDLGGDSVFVAFSGLGRVNDGTRFWGDRFFMKHGLSAIGIMGTRPNWFPRAATDGVIDAVRRQIDGRRVITYGHSQGGYGALKFAASLEASIALAFCPQWSINPADVASFDTRFVNYFDPSLDNGLRIVEEDLCERSFVFFDRVERLDALNAEKILGLRGVEPVIAPISMHGRLRLASEGGSAAEIMKLCARSAIPLAGELRNLIRASRRESAAYQDHTLRHLLSRAHNASTHPAKFLRGSMQRASHDHPCHRALAAYAAGDTVLAQSELDRCASLSFRDVNLILLWRMAHMIRFLAAELMLAEELCTAQAANTAVCLAVVQTFIRAGRTERAHAELVRLAKAPDASHHIWYFVACSLAMRNTDIVESFLSQPLTGAARTMLLFQLVNLYNRLGNRPGAFRALRQLAAIDSKEPGHLRRIADELHKIGEDAYALELREVLRKRLPADHRLALDVVEARIPADKGRARAQLERILRAPDLDATCWERASLLYEKLSDLEAAVRAAEKAVARSGGAFSARCRLVAALMEQRKSSRARQELETLLRESSADPDRLRTAGDLADRLGDPSFSLMFAQAQYRCGRDPQSVMFLARYSRLAGDRELARELLSTLYRTERRFPTMPEQQWARLAQALYDVGERILAKAAALEAVARNPTNVPMKKLVATIDLLQSHREASRSTAPRIAIPPSRASHGIA